MSRAGVPLAERFRRDLRAGGLIRPRERVLAAVSGGLDSVTLLHLLRFHAPFPLTLHAAHFDHRMRADSASDRAWVAGLCEAWRVPLIADAAAAVPHAEASARDARYAFLARAADVARAHRIATAHHADDQAETILFRLLRGTGLRGLRGIPERRGRFIRPLLGVTRAEIAHYADTVGLRWREDPSNIRLDRARNRIRLAVLPALEAARPGITAQLTALGRDAAAAERVWSTLEDRLLNLLLIRHDEASLELARDLLLRYHPMVRARVLRAALLRLDSVPDRAGTHAALTFISSGAGGGVIELAGGVRIEREFDRLVLRRGSATAPGADRPLSIHSPGEGAGEAMIGGRRVAVRWSSGPGAAGAHSAAFDPGALRFPLVLRGWRPGDRIRLDYGSKKLKKLFAERRIARGTRSRIPVLAQGQDRIVWIVGLARAAEAAPAPGGPRLHITVNDAEHG